MKLKGGEELEFVLKWKTYVICIHVYENLVFVTNMYVVIDLCVI